MKTIKKILVISLCILLGLIVLLAIAIGGALAYLKPERLTPLVCELANDNLDAHVSIGRVELGFRPKYPMLYLGVDSLTIVSKAFDGLSEEYRRALPEYCDTLLTVDHLSGAANVMAFLKRNEIALHDLVISGAGMNIVMAGNGLGNFDIYNSQSGPDTTSLDEGPVKFPKISLDRFSFTDPREIRYFNALDSTEATVVLLADAGVDGTQSPLYRLKLDGRLDSPVARTLLQLEELGFGIDGRVNWNPEEPSRIAISDCDVRSEFIEAKISADLLFDTTMVVERARVALAPVPVQKVVELMPEKMQTQYSLQNGLFSTDARISADIAITEPFILGSDTIPHATARITMPECSLRYGKARFDALALDLAAELKGNDPDAAVVNVERLLVAGPATALTIAGSVTNVATDPAFSGSVSGKCNLKNLPPIVADKIGGFISGRLKADVHARGNVSMFAADEFHRLDVSGKLEGEQLYFLANDTAKMVDIDHASLNFGTRTTVKNDSLPGGTPPLLTAKIQVDTARVLIDGVSILVGSLDLGLGTLNQKTNGDTTLVMPMGGGIKIGRFDVESITDSAGARVRQLIGTVRLKRYKNNSHTPEIIANLEASRLSAGSRTTRVLLRKAKIHAETHKIPVNKERRNAIKKAADSISRLHPDLPMDSVYKLAIAKRRHRPGEPRHHRVHGQMTDEDNEIIEWGISKGFSRFLLGWRIDGSVETRRARLFTPFFPLRNSISNLEIKFNNDSLNLKGVRYRAGHSDLAVTGLISNLKRALTSKTGVSPLKMNFDIVSDTLDVNQIASAVFAGSAYAERLRTDTGTATLNLDSDENDLDRELDALVDGQPDSIGPLLVPMNIDAQLHLKANNIHYSDLTFTGLKGDLLMFDGALNMHNLTAASDAGSLNMSALYFAPKPTDMHFGFSLELDRIDIGRFLSLVPAVDSVMPMMRDFSGIIDADLAATVNIDPKMNLELPSLDAAVRIQADSLAFINPETYKTLGKWLRFKDRTDNRVKHVNVEMIVRDNMLRIFPFEFDIDRYRLGITGSNDLALNFDYHIAVLKSPIPFKFGITIKGNPEHYKVRFGGARFKAGEMAKSVNVVDTARVNLIKQFENVFRRGVRRSRFAKLKVDLPTGDNGPEPDAQLSPADSLVLIREGLIAPESLDGLKDNE